MIGSVAGKPSRYVIDFDRRTLLEAQEYKALFKRVEARVLPDRVKAAEKEREQNKEAVEANPKAKLAKDHSGALDKWWLHFRAREKMVKAISALPRYIVCGRVTKRPIFAFVDPAIHPNDSLAVFPLADDYSFGILQSGIHWQWFTERCSTLKADWRYTSNTVFDSFPWPQEPTTEQVAAVAEAAVALRHHRDELIKKHALSLRELYRSLENPGSHSLKDAHGKLDAAVRAAYGMAKDADPVEVLFGLNQELAAAEDAGEKVGGPGLPASIEDRNSFRTGDRLLP
jgi:hypothetical protein